jgi:hypothetical protein
MRPWSSVALSLIIVFLAAAPISAGPLSLMPGPTPIAGGSCSAAGDLTVLTDHYAVSFAVETRPPWGVPPGSILDAAPVSNGIIQEDRIGFIDFLPDSWNDWQNSRHDVRVTQTASDRASVTVTRDFRGIPVTTTYRFDASSPNIEVVSVIGPAPTALDGPIRSGYSLCTRKASVFGPRPDGAPPEWVAGFGPDWVAGLVFPGAQLVVGGNSWRDLYLSHSLPADSTTTLAATLRILPAPDVAGVTALHQSLRGVELGLVTGSTAPPQGPIPKGTTVVFSRDDRIVAWTGVDGLGQFAAQLPHGRYSVRASAPHHGWTEAAEVLVGPIPAQVTLPALRPPGQIRLTVSLAGQPVAARVRIAGEPGPIAYLQQNVHFTAIAQTGVAQFDIAPGPQTLLIDGGGIGTATRTLLADVKPGETFTKSVFLERVLDLTDLGWYCADLHHHTDLADGATPPAASVLAQAAAGLSLATVTDHDLVVNHAPFLAAASKLGMPAILGIEVSPTWGHFNLFPLPMGQAPDTPSAHTTPTAILAEASRLGAYVQANHPWERANAYFRSWLKGTVPGRIRTEYAFVEINADGGFGPDDQTALAQVHLAWNEGQTYVLTAGSDTHDVWTERADATSGAGQTCVSLGDRSLSTASFFEALAHGRAVATLGPAVTVTPLPGSRVRRGRALLVRVKAFARKGISHAEVYANGRLLRTQHFPNGDGLLSFALTLDTNGLDWLQLVLYDRDGNPALVNPWWID